MRLTNEKIAALPAPAVRKEIADDLRPGLYLIHQPSGSKSWAVRYRFRKGFRKYTLGQWPAIRLGETREAKAARLASDPDSLSPCARERARDVLARVATGEDPTTGRAGSATLVRNVWADYAERHLSKKRGATADSAKRLYDKRLKAWADRDIKDIAKRDVLDVLDAITAAGHPAAALRARAVMSGFFNWAMGRDLIRQSPCNGIAKPTSEEAADDEGAEDGRILTDSELRLFWRACNATPYPFGPLFKLLALTGQRRDEIAKMRDDEISLAARLFKLPPSRSKNRKAHDVYLADAALAVIESLPRVENEAGYLFSTNGVSACSGYSRAKKNLDKLIAELNGGKMIPAWRLHDLRRTMISGMARLGITLPVIERCANHISGSFAGIVGVYQKHSYANEKAAAFKAWASHIERLKRQAAGNVVQLRAS
jgi:integrase